VIAAETEVRETFRDSVFRGFCSHSVYSCAGEMPRKITEFFHPACAESWLFLHPVHNWSKKDRMMCFNVSERNTLGFGGAKWQEQVFKFTES